MAENLRIALLLKVVLFAIINFSHALENLSPNTLRVTVKKLILRHMSHIVHHLYTWRLLLIVVLKKQLLKELAMSVFAC